MLFFPWLVYLVSVHALQIKFLVTKMLCCTANFLSMCAQTIIDLQRRFPAMPPVSRDFSTFTTYGDIAAAHKPYYAFCAGFSAMPQVVTSPPSLPSVICAETILCLLRRFLAMPQVETSPPSPPRVILQLHTNHIMPSAQVLSYATSRDISTFTTKGEGTSVSSLIVTRLKKSDSGTLSQR